MLGRESYLHTYTEPELAKFTSYLRFNIFTLFTVTLNVKLIIIKIFFLFLPLFCNILTYMFDSKKIYYVRVKKMYYIIKLP